MQSKGSLRNLMYYYIQVKPPNSRDYQYLPRLSENDSSMYTSSHFKVLQLEPTYDKTYPDSNDLLTKNFYNATTQYNSNGQEDKKTTAIVDMHRMKLQNCSNNIPFTMQNFVSDRDSIYSWNSNKMLNSSHPKKDICFNVDQNKGHKKKHPIKASREQLAVVAMTLTDMLPGFFDQSNKHPYEIYSKNLIFDNRIFGTKTTGRNTYISQALILKQFAALKFSSTKFIILKITQHEDDCSIKMRWRIEGIPYRLLSSLIPSKNVENKSQHSWYDGFSIFYINCDGHIHHHEVDMAIPDEERRAATNMSIGSKIALALGLSITPKPAEM